MLPTRSFIALLAALAPFTALAAPAVDSEESIGVFVRGADTVEEMDLSLRDADPNGDLDASLWDDDYGYDYDYDDEDYDDDDEYDDDDDMSYWDEAPDNDEDADVDMAALFAARAANSTDGDVEPQAAYWAQFCDDRKCSKNCGQSVAVKNDGCLNGQAGRKSIKFHGGWFKPFSLVGTPGQGCNCQNKCKHFKRHRGCFKLDAWTNQGSYRFIMQKCAKKNC